ncbi:MAG: sugar ABC transporter permease YjfF [Anaerolineae bacterium]|nr:sugar ABC transporter permease YjfF [Anaerolineae bacterium]
MSRRFPFRIDRKYLPVMVTIALFFTTFLAASLKYRGFGTAQVFFNMLIDNSFIIISAIGVTFVLLTGGIDLSMGAMIAFTSMVSAALVEKAHISPFITIPTVLALGALIGSGMGAIITYYKVPPFIATLAGMFLTRGLCFIISIDAVPINDPFYKAVSLYQIPVWGKAFVSINVVITLVVVLLAVYVAHYTRFGRTVYAIGGGEQSALLMGLPVKRTKVLVYALNGFCSALAGVVYSFYMLSGYGYYANGFELDIISSAVIGGTLLSGGVGYVIGTVFGVLIQGIIQNIIMFEGTLNSWWTRIVVGLLTLFFIVMQRALSSIKNK